MFNKKMGWLSPVNIAAIDNVEEIFANQEKLAF